MSDVPEKSASGDLGCGEALGGSQSLMSVFLEVGAFFEGQLDFHNLNIIIWKTQLSKLNGQHSHPKNSFTLFTLLLSPLIFLSLFILFLG